MSVFISEEDFELPKIWGRMLLLLEFLTPSMVLGKEQVPHVLLTSI